MIIHDTGTASNFTNPGSFGNAFTDAVTKGFNTSVYSDIYISGYFYILWTRVPEFMKKDSTEKILGDFSSMSQVMCTSVQIPDINLNVVEVVTGFGGTNKLSIPTGVDMDTSLTVTYNEMSGTPISKFHQRWISGIRDYASGVSDIPNYSIRNYTGELLYITTKPVHYASQGSFGKSTGQVPNQQMVETAHLFCNVFPVSDRQSLFSANIESSDKISIEMNYRFSQMFQGQQVTALAQRKLGEMIKLKDADFYVIDDDGSVRSSFSKDP